MSKINQQYHWRDQYFEMNDFSFPYMYMRTKIYYDKIYTFRLFGEMLTSTVLTLEVDAALSETDAKHQAEQWFFRYLKLQAFL